jgi:hypothetical protein
VSEDRDHVFIGISVKVMYLIPFVEQISKGVRRRCIGYCRRNYVRHVAMVTIFWNTKFRVGVKLANGAKMDITTEYG